MLNFVRAFRLGRFNVYSGIDSEFKRKKGLTIFSCLFESGYRSPNFIYRFHPLDIYNIGSGFLKPSFDFAIQWIIWLDDMRTTKKYYFLSLILYFKKIVASFFANKRMFPTLLIRKDQVLTSLNS